MRKLIVFMFSIVLLGSCQKDISVSGCIDPTALNYSNLATEDDGSCMYESQSVFIEYFTVTFNNTIATDFYIPTFNYEDGDLIIIETKNEWDEWTALPYIVGIDIHLEGGYSDNGTVWIYLYNDDQVLFYSPLEITHPFRAALIKANALQINPDLKGMKIDEINSAI